MKIAILGASAGLGLTAVTRALDAGHTVTTLSRTTDALPVHTSLHSITGSALDPAAVRQAIADAETVLVTLGTGRSRQGTTLFSDSMAYLLAATRSTAASPPVIAVTGFGAGDSALFKASSREAP